MSRQAHWGIGLLLLQPLGAWALGLGEIELNSALNQPLSAEIRLVSASAEEMDTLKVALASRETFERYGLDRPAFLGDVTFSVGRDSRGRNVINVETTQSVTEPFVTILVEATWPRGRLLKEYTVLLDPPVLLPQPEAATNVQAPTANTPAPSQAGGRIQRPVSRPEPAPAPSSSPAPIRNLPTSGGGTYGPVQRNETLWRIAEQVRPDARISMNQMMVALYQANPEAFDGNINRLRRGAVLQVPSGADIGAITTRNATAEVRRQNQAWRGSRGVAEPGLRLVAPDDSGATGSQAASTSTGGDPQLRNEVQALRDELAERDRLLAIKDQELQALQEQLASISAGVDDMAPADGVVDPADDGALTDDPGTAISDDELFADDPAVVDTTQPEPVVTPEPAPSPTTVVTTAPESKGIVATILEWVFKPLVLIGAGVLALLVFGLWFMRRRQEAATDITGRWEALEAEAEDDGGDAVATREATARMRAQAEPESIVVEEAAPGEATMPGIDPTTAEAALEDTPALFGDETLSSQTAINLDQADPVAEADFHMAYGLYDQAADLLQKAVQDEPNRRDLKLKLLEVFFVWDNKDSFRETAQALRTEMGDAADADWDKVAIMGKQICPTDALFSEAVEGAAVDLDLDAGGDVPLDFPLEDASAGGIDLDLGESIEEVGAPTAATEALESVDIGEQTAAGLESAFQLDGDDTSSRTTPDLEGLAETMESPTIEQPGVDTPTEETPALDETLEIPDSSPTAESPTVEIPAEAPTMESPTLETPMTELPTIEQPMLAGGEQTEEIDLNDLGLDLEGLDQLPDEGDSLAATGRNPAAESGEDDTQNREGLTDLDPDDDLLSATGVTQVLEGDVLEHANTEVLTDEEATMMAPAFDEGTMARTEILPRGDDDDDLEATNRVEVLVEDDTPDPGATTEFKSLDEDLDLDLGDLSAALDGGETVEQPGPGGSFPNAIFDGDGSGDLDLDIGSSVADNDGPTVTEQVGVIDPQTLTEVGTKLDLARAYIDMGDPEGARSILDEVLKEGDPSQRQEAEGLISGLGA